MNKAQKDWCETVLWSFVHGAALNLGLADSKDSDDSALYREMMICISTFDRVGEGTRWKVTLEQETDGRWIGEVESVPGALAYGETKEEAAVKAAEIARAAEPSPQEFYETNATNVCNVPRPGHPEDPSGWAGVRRASEARFVAGDCLVMTLADAFDFAEKYKAADNRDSPLMRLREKIARNDD